MSSVRNIRQRKNPNNMNVTVVVETGLHVRAPKMHWWSAKKYTSFNATYRRTFTTNPYARDANDIRLGETINLNPGAEPKILLEVRDINHIDKDNVELVVIRRHMEFWGSMATHQKTRAKYDEFIMKLKDADYQLAPRV